MDFYHCRVVVFTQTTHIYVQTPRKSGFCIIGALKKKFKNGRVLEANSNYSEECPLTIRELISLKYLTSLIFLYQSSLMKTVGVDQIPCESIIYLCRSAFSKSNKSAHPIDARNFVVSVFVSHVCLCVTSSKVPFLRYAYCY